MLNINENLVEWLYKDFKSHGIHTWFIGTNLFNIWCKIINVLRQEDNQHDSGIKIKKLENSRYKIFCNKLDLSNVLGKNEKSKSVINQYINFGLALKLIDYTNNSFQYRFNINVIEGLKKTASKNIITNFTFKLLNEFFEKQFKNNNKYASNICCSLIFKIIYQEANKDLKPFIEKRIIDLKSKHKKNINEKIDRFMLQSGYEYIVKNFSIHQRDKLLDLIFYFFSGKNDIDSSIDYLALNKVCNSYKSNSNLPYKKVFVEEILRKYTIEYIGIRHKLRENIIKLIGNKDYWSDFMNVEIRHIDDLEACHIKEVNKIKKQNNTNISEYYDYNNGLLMNRDAHYLFDQKIFTFSSNDGRILFMNNDLESKKRVAIAFKVDINRVDSIQIKRLTKEMSSFLKQRIK